MTEQTPQLPSETKLAVPQCALCGDTGIVLYDDQHGEPRNAQCTCKVAPFPANAEAGDVQHLIRSMICLALELPEPVYKAAIPPVIDALRSLAAVRATNNGLHEALQRKHERMESIERERDKAERERDALARENERLREALEELLAAPSKGYDIVGQDTDGHPLSAEGVARTKARAAIGELPEVGK